MARPFLWRLLLLALVLSGCAAANDDDRPLQVAPAAQHSPLARMTLI